MRADNNLGSYAVLHVMGDRGGEAYSGILSREGRVDEFECYVKKSSAYY